MEGDEVGVVMNAHLSILRYCNELGCDIRRLVLLMVVHLEVMEQKVQIEQESKSRTLQLFVTTRKM